MEGDWAGYRWVLEGLRANPQGKVGGRHQLATEYALYLPRRKGGLMEGFEAVKGDIDIDAPLRNYTYSTGSAGSKSPPMKTFCRSSVPSHETTEDPLPTSGRSSGTVLLLMIGTHMGWKNRLTALFLILVPPTKVEGAHERIGLVSGFFPGGRSAWEGIRSAEEEAATRDYRERISFLKGRLSREDFDWCKYLPVWRVITIV